MEWFIHNHDSIIKQWTLKALTVKPKASHTQHAPPGPQRSQRHWTFLNARRLPPSQSPPYFFVFPNSPHPVTFFPCSFFFNHLNIFWYKKKQAHVRWINHVCDLLLPPFTSCYRPCSLELSAPPAGLEDERDTSLLNPLSSCARSHYWHLKEKKTQNVLPQNDKGVMEVGETVLRKKNKMKR